MEAAFDQLLWQGGYVSNLSLVRRNFDLGERSDTAHQSHAMDEATDHLCHTVYDDVFKNNPLFKPYALQQDIPVLSPIGFPDCRWFKDADVVTYDYLKKHMANLRTTMTRNFVDFTKSKGRIFRLYGDWCKERKLDYSTEDVNKVVEFMKSMAERVEPKKRTKAAAAVVQLRYSSFCMERLRMYQGWTLWDLDGKHNPGSITQSEAYKQLMDGYKATMEEEQRTRIPDVTQSRVQTHRLMPAEAERMQGALQTGAVTETIMSASARDAMLMRVNWLHAIATALARRPADIRSMKISQMTLHPLPAILPAECIAIRIGLQKFKEQSLAHNELSLGFARNKNREACALGALASFEVFKHDVAVQRANTIGAIKRYLEDLKAWIKDEGRDKPSPEWRRHHIVFSSDPCVEISGSTHNKDLKRLMAVADVTGKGAAATLPRSNTISELFEQGENAEDILHFGNWGPKTEMRDTYAKGTFHARLALKVAGWPSCDQYFCGWEGKEADIPPPLLQAVFPDLAATYRLCLEAERATKRYPTRLGPSDWMTELEACKLYKHLRKVFLEDAAYKTSPGLFQHEVFEMDEWQAYVSAERTRVEARLKQFHDATPEGMLKRLLENKDSIEVKPEKKKKKEESMTMPEVLEPTDLCLAYQQFKDIWQKETDLTWKEWFDDDASKHRYDKSHDAYKYIDRAVETGLTAEEVIDKLECVANELNVTTSVLVKNCFYYYFHPPKNGKDKRKVQPEQIRDLLMKVGLPYPD